MGVLAGLWLLLAGCETVDDPSAGGTSQPATTGPATAVGPPVEVCELVDLAILDGAGVAVETTYQSTTGGVLPFDACPLFPADEEGARVSIGELAVAMTPTSPDAFEQIRTRLEGVPVTGVGEAAFTVGAGELADSPLPAPGGFFLGLYARWGEVVVALVRPNEEIPQAARVALVEEAFRRLASPFPFTPQAWPAECDRLDQQLVADLLGGPVVAARGDVDDRNLSCKLFTAPGWVAIYFRQEPSSLDPTSLDPVPGIEAEAYTTDPQVGYVLAGEREAYVDVWLPGADLAGSKTGSFAPAVLPALGALFQGIADALAS